MGFRDRHQLSDYPDVRMSRKTLAIGLLSVVMAVPIAFVVGLAVGRHSMQRDSAASADVLTQIDADKRFQESLTFYDTLTDPTRPNAEAGRRALAKPGDPHGAVQHAVPSPDAEAGGDKPATAFESEEPASEDLKASLAAGPARIGEYTVQVSAFESEGEAQAYASALRRKGFTPFVISASVPGKGTWHRVRVGRFTTEAAANEGKRVLAGADIPGWVVEVQ